MGSLLLAFLYRNVGEGSVFCCLMWSFDRLNIEDLFIIGGKWVVQAEATDLTGCVVAVENETRQTGYETAAGRWCAIIDRRRNTVRDVWI